MAGVMKRLTFADGVVVADPPDLADFIGTTVIYPVTFSSESSKDVNVGADGFDARYCLVEVRDSADNHSVQEISYYAVDAGTLRLVAGSSISATLSVTVSQ